MSRSCAALQGSAKARCPVCCSRTGATSWRRRSPTPHGLPGLEKYVGSIFSWLPELAHLYALEHDVRGLKRPSSGDGIACCEFSATNEFPAGELDSVRGVQYALCGMSVFCRRKCPSANGPRLALTVGRTVCSLRSSRLATTARLRGKSGHCSNDSLHDIALYHDFE